MRKIRRQLRKELREAKTREERKRVRKLINSPSYVQKEYHYRNNNGYYLIPHEVFYDD